MRFTPPMSDGREGLIHRLADGRWVLAFWNECAGIWHPISPEGDRRGVTARTLEQLVERGARAYDDRAAAEAAARLLST